MKFDVLGGSGRHLEASRRHLEAARRHLGASWRHLEASGSAPRACLGASWGPPGDFLEQQQRINKLAACASSHLNFHTKTPCCESSALASQDPPACSKTKSDRRAYPRNSDDSQRNSAVVSIHRKDPDRAVVPEPLAGVLMLMDRR